MPLDETTAGCRSKLPFFSSRAGDLHWTDTGCRRLRDCHGPLLDLATAATAEPRSSRHDETTLTGSPLSGPRLRRQRHSGREPQSSSQHVQTAASKPDQPPRQKLFTVVLAGLCFLIGAASITLPLFTFFYPLLIDSVVKNGLFGGDENGGRKVLAVGGVGVDGDGDDMGCTNMDDGLEIMEMEVWEMAVRDNGRVGEVGKIGGSLVADISGGLVKWGKVDGEWSTHSYEVGDGGE
ncbi:hypothetical protein LR48_Vigan07g039000 [Vigna angularis]|uniref:Uncharacterized protein n=1 Tax=Phaseolus angularis TaxID=3914 RepID=A0A0L9UVC3_PHAAN|nr:hypothetical protein LR48_Vigan07g039000 [Vigna angularis]